MLLHNATKQRRHVKSMPRNSLTIYNALWISSVRFFFGCFLIYLKKRHQNPTHHPASHLSDGANIWTQQAHWRGRTLCFNWTRLLMTGPSVRVATSSNLLC
jgi:hypothetical protein